MMSKRAPTRKEQRHTATKTKKTTGKTPDTRNRTGRRVHAKVSPRKSKASQVIAGALAKPLDSQSAAGVEVDLGSDYGPRSMILLLDDEKILERLRSTFAKKLASAQRCKDKRVFLDLFSGRNFPVSGVCGRVMHVFLLNLGMIWTHHEDKPL